MAKLNLYKIDARKKDDFCNNLEDNMIKISEKSIENGAILFKLYAFFPEENNKGLNWNWLLEEFEESKVMYTSQPRAVLLIEKGEVLYVASFGSSYFQINKYCDRAFAFDFAKRCEYVEVKTTAVNAPNAQKNKMISSFKNCKDFIYDSGESYQKIKATINILEDESRFNKSIEIGTSIKFSMKENTLQNICKIIDHVEEVLTYEIIHKIPLFTEIKDERVDTLDCLLVEAIKKGEAKVSFKNFEIFGVTETFFEDELGFKITFEEYEKTTVELNSGELKAFIEECNIRDEDILNIGIIPISDEHGSQGFKLKSIIDYIEDSEKAVIESGKWYEYNDDYLTYLKESLEEIPIVYDPKFDSFEDEYEKFLDELYEELKDSEEHSGKEEAAIRKSIRTKFYRERAFNMLRARKDGFKNFDRDTEIADGQKYEVMDLLKDKTAYAVKIGNTSAKLDYAFDQSTTSARMMKKQKEDIENCAVWLILDRHTKLKEIDGTVDLNDLDMLMLKNKIDAWKKEIRNLGYKPIIHINYITTRQP